jgi:hypothetical protein
MRRTAAVAVVVTFVAACGGHSDATDRSATVRRVPRGAVRFVDVTSRAGLTVVQSARRTGSRCLFDPNVLHRRFPHAAFAATRTLAKDRCVPERMSGGVAVGDFDGDGWPDMYFTRLDGPGVLYRNQHDGSFADVTRREGLDALAEPSNGAAFVDVDGDGRLDLFVTTLAGRRWYLYMNRSGRFADEAAARGVAVDDGNAHSGFSVDVGDVNGDGYPDLRTAEWRISELVSTGPSHTRLLLNRGAARPGFFVDVTARAGAGDDPHVPGVFAFASALTDIDGDGSTDIVAVNDFGRTRMLWGDGRGAFGDGTRAAGFGADENGMGLTIADYDGDGRPDVFVSSIYDRDQRCRNGACARGTTGNRLYRYIGRRKFADVTSRAGVRDGGWGWGAAFVDTTNEGLDDLVSTSGVAFPWEPGDRKFAGGGMHFWRNRGDGTFASVSACCGIVVPGPGKGLALLDYDRDGRTDIVVVRDGDHPVLLHNESKGTGSWLDVRAVGRSGMTAYGATVTVVVGRHRWIRSVDSPTHFLAASSPDPHFGLGAATKADQVSVQWPGRRGTTVLHDVAIDRTITIRTGQ